MDARGLGAGTRLDRTQDDLNKFRQRIDNNVEQQREYSEMMSALQNKVLTQFEGKDKMCQNKAIMLICSSRFVKKIEFFVNLRKKKECLQVHEYRRHIADLEARMLGNRSRQLDAGLDPATVMVFDDHSYL